MKSIRSTNPRLLACLLSLSCVVAACIRDAGEPVSRVSSALIKCPSSSPAVNLGDLPISFVENQGQSPDEVLFQGVALGAGTLAVTADGVRLDLADFPGAKAIPATSIVLHHEGASLSLTPAPGAGLTSTTTFVTATGTQSQVPNHSALAQEELYPGIGVQLGGTARKLVTTYAVDPGASPFSIQWSYVGATDLSIDPGVGSVSVVVAGGARTLSLGPVEAHQVIQGKQIPVTGHYVVSDGVLGVALDDYDATEQVVITTRLLHSPFFQAGGTTAVNGRTYAVGRGYHASSSVKDTYGDAYVAVVDDATGQLTSTTFLIGEDDDEAHAVAITGDGDIVVAGETRSLAFPTLGAVQGDNAGGSDGFVISLDSEGATLLHGTYLGTPEDEAATGVTEAPGGDILVASTTSAPAPAVNAASASFVLSLPAKGPSPTAAHYALTSLGAALASTHYQIPVKGPRIRRPRAWIDCNGRPHVGVFGLSTQTCSPLPVYTMAEYGKDYVQDQPSALSHGGTTFGWGYHALRWKFFLVNDGSPPPSQTMLSWAPFDNNLWLFVPMRAQAPQVSPGSLSDDPHQLNQFENAPVPSWEIFSPNNPRGDWEGGDHDTIETLMIKAALIEHKWHSPLYMSKTSYDLQGNGYTHAMAVEQTNLDVCFDPSVVNYQGEKVEDLCTFPAVADWWGGVDCLSPGVHDITFELDHFKVSTWGELSPNPMYFHENFDLTYTTGWQNQWYEQGNFVYDPPAEELQASQKLDEAAARLAGRITAQITVEERAYKDGVAGNVSTVSLTARAIDLH